MCIRDRSDCLRSNRSGVRISPGAPQFKHLGDCPQSPCTESVQLAGSLDISGGHNSPQNVVCPPKSFTSGVISSYMASTIRYTDSGISLYVVFQRGVRSAVAQLLLHVLERSLALTDRACCVGPSQDLEIQLCQS